MILLKGHNLCRGCLYIKDANDLKLEIAFVKRIIEHEAGFNLDLFRLLNVRGNDQGTYEVEYGAEEEGEVIPRYKECETSEEAAKLFCEWRRELEIGEDIEGRLCCENGLVDELYEE